MDYASQQQPITGASDFVESNNSNSGQSTEVAGAGLVRDENGIVIIGGRPVAMGVAPNPRLIMLALTVTAKKVWKVGDDIYQKTAKGNFPSWSTIRARFWKNESAKDGASERYSAENLERMRRGSAPQRYNQDKGDLESMELSHEPIPARDGGTKFVPRWPQDHAEIDPFRRPGY